MAQLSGNDLTVRVQTKSDTSGVDDTSRRLTGLESTAEQVSTKTSGMTAAFFKAGLALEAVKFAADLASKAVGTVWQFTQDAIKSAAAYEQSAIAFEVMLGSADKARQMLKDVSAFARRTPFELPELIETTKRLLAYNIAAEDIIPTLTNLGNITAGIGREKMPQLILAYGQVRAATRLTGAELRQFTEAGVPLIQTLADQFGVTQGRILDMVSEGVIGFDAVEQAIASMSAEGGQFFGLMERQSKTYDGTISNLRDNFGQMAREIIGISNDGTIREGSVFQTLSNKARELLKWVDDNRAGIERFGRGLLDGLVSIVEKHVLPKLQQFADWLTNPRYAGERQRWIDKLSEFARAAGAVASAGASIVNWIASAIGWFDRLYSKIKPVTDILQKIVDFSPPMLVTNLLTGRLPGLDQFKSVARSLGIPGFAEGTNFAPGGMALVGERGPELVNLPRGSQVVPNHQLKSATGSQITFNQYNTIHNEIDMDAAMRQSGYMLATRI